MYLDLVSSLLVGVLSLLPLCERPLRSLRKDCLKDFLKDFFRDMAESPVAIKSKKITKFFTEEIDCNIIYKANLLHSK